MVIFGKVPKKNRLQNIYVPGRCDGFSLIEMSIALIIAALFIVPLAAIYQISVKQAISSTNVSRMTEVQETINFFAVNSNRYPRPASLYAAPGDTDYGLEFSGAIDDCAGWPTASGVCRSGVGATAVLIGAVPFVDLGMNPDIAHDYWDNKILYAVTETQTAVYAPGMGQISVQGYSDNVAFTLVTLSTDNDMALVSHGENGRGAYTRSGTALSACTTGVPSPETENCNMNNIFVLRSYTDALSGDPIGMTSLIPGPDYYDDYVLEQDGVPQDLWLQSLFDSDYALTFASRIGMGTIDPQERMHVVGVVRADDLMTDNVCDNALAGCFNPEIIGGAVPAMDCDQNSINGREAVLSIGNSQVYCASPVDTGSPPNPIDGRAYEFPLAYFARGVECGLLGKKMVGFLAGGVPDCQ